MKKFFTIIWLTTLIIIQLPVLADNKIEEYMNIEWWKNFKDEYLIENLIKLYENNYDLKNAALKIKENEQMVKMQFADELPGIYLSGNLSRDLQAPRQQFGNMQIPKYSQYNYNIPITAGYEIDIWGKNHFKTKSKKKQLEIIKQAQRATYISLSSDFASEYFNLIKADKLIQIQNELINTQEEILSKIKQKYQTGLCNINEVLFQEKLLTDLKEEYNKHIETRDFLIDSLKYYQSNTTDDINRNNYENTILINNIPNQYSTDIITNRPDYLQEEANLKRIGFDVKAAKREFLPTFTIFGQIGLNAYHLSSLFDSPSQFFTAGILPSIDLFSGGRKAAFFKIKKYQYEQALNDYQKTFLVGIKELNSGLIEFKTAIRNYEETQKKLTIESKIYNLVKDKKQIGSASELDTLIAKEIYLSAEKEEVSNKINSIISIIGLYKAAGGINLYNINEDI